MFYAVLPDGSGACASGMLPVYRFFRPSTNNHRYTMEEDVRQLLASTPGWIAEGAGNGVVFCSPQN